MDLSNLLEQGEYKCSCGKIHHALVKKTVIEDGAIAKIPQLIKDENAKSVFMLCDLNTYAVAGKKTEQVLTESGIIVKKYVFQTTEVIEPDEHAVGSAIMHYSDCDVIIGVGSGVINDIGKIVAAVAKKTYMIVGTAPSMDGYASATSSMARDGLKVSLPSKCPDIVVGDLDVLANAPMDMIRAGVGDMLAKYISVCEWRIAQILCGEYYCSEIAAMVRTALAEVVGLAPGLMNRDKAAVKAVMDGMVLSGIAANYATISRPVSGLEHYFSHVWDMRGLSFGTPVYLHGIQCGAATVEAIKVYDYLRDITPDRERALKFVESFNLEEHNAKMLEFVGEGSRSMIAQEEKEGKYDKAKHAQRLERIIEHWDELVQIFNRELPTLSTLVKRIKEIGAPADAASLNKSNEEIAKTLVFAKDIRDKYVGSRLLWDLGLLDDYLQKTYGVKL